MNATERYAFWMNSPDVDEQTKAELRAIANDPKEIEERFYTELEFGTAGLRGILGAGDNRMNVYNVRKATEGLARYLCDTVNGTPRVCIAYDSRHCSDLFAKETACVLAGHGIKVFLYSTLHSVPQLSFTVLELHCDAGVVITASHNPPKYNGYKVYGRSGGQSAPEEAQAITDRIREVEGFQTAYKPFDEAVNDGTITLIGKDVDEIYYQKTMTLLTQPELVKEKGKDLKLVYTPLHGSGNVPVREVLKRIGVTNVTVVKEQEAPDGDFPTVKAPNPEDPNAFTLAFRYAKEVGATVIIGTDPDSDRLGLAVRKTDGDWAVLTGNQIGAILIHSLLSSYRATGKLPENGLVVRSIVSTQLADAICARFGVECREVLTGFRFISEQIAECERTHERTFLFGFEESYGFLAGGFARDKDAICAAMLVAEACVVYAEKGMTLYDALLEIYETYGFYREKVKSYTLEGKDGIEAIKNAMALLRETPPASIAGTAVAKTEDFLKPEETGLPRSNVLRFTLSDGAWVTVRPSGTEPKLKLYIGAHAENDAAVQQKLDGLMRDMDEKLTALLGLK
jgi:phosphoglucomutase